MTKRPDVALRNKLNNPMNNPKSLEKMRQSLTGKKQPESTKLKRSQKLMAYYASNPEALKKLQKELEAKHLSKVRGKGWRLARLEALKRDGYRCQHCGKSGGTELVVHHLDWNGKERGKSMKGMNNALDNLLTLCHKCHNGLHRHKSADYQDRKLKQIAP